MTDARDVAVLPLPLVASPAMVWLSPRFRAFAPTTGGNGFVATPGLTVQVGD